MKILIKPAVVIYLGILLTFLSWHSIHFQVDYFDSFSVLKTAKGLAEGAVIDFNWRKPPLLSILLAPLFSLQNMFGLDGMAHATGRLLCVACLAALAWLTARLIAFFLDQRYALIGALFLVSNPLFIHNTPFCKDDLLGTLLANLAIYLYARYQKNNKLTTALGCALAAGFALTARYNFLPTLTLFFFAAEAIHWASHRSALAQGAKRCVMFLGLPWAVFFIVHMFLYQYLGVATFFGAPVEIVRHLTRAYELMATGEPPLKNYIFLLRTLSWPVLALFVGGLAVSVARKEKAHIPYALWFLVYFVFHTYFVDHKEARYLMPVYPVIYFFAVLGWRELAGSLKRFCATQGISHTASAGVIMLLAVSIALFPLKNALTEGRRLSDPFYRLDFEKEVSRFADELSGDGDIVWVGPHYPLVPREYIFDINDDFWYMFHFAAHVVYFYTGKDVVPVLAQPLALEGSPFIFVPLILQFADDGDVLIINREGEDFRGSNFPRSIRPLYVQKVKAFKFPRSGSPQEYRLSHSEEGSGPSILRFETVDNSAQLAGRGIADGMYELYFHREGEPHAAHVNFISVKNNEFSIRVTDLPSWDNIKEIVLLTYTDGAAFSHPTYPGD